MWEVLSSAGLALAIASPIVSAVWCVACVRAELAGLRRDVDRHETELRELRRVGAI